MAGRWARCDVDGDPERRAPSRSGARDDDRSPVVPGGGAVVRIRCATRYGTGFAPGTRSVIGGRAAAGRRGEERRRHLAVVEQHLALRVGDSLHARRRLAADASVDLAALVGVQEPSGLRRGDRVRARGDGLRLQRGWTASPSALTGDDALHVVVEADHVHDLEPLPETTWSWICPRYGCPAT